MSLHIISDEDLMELSRSNISLREIIVIQERVLTNAAPTCDLVNELTMREGVTEIVCPDPNSAFSIGVDRSDGIEIDPSSGAGPARILVVID